VTVRTADGDLLAVDAANLDTYNTIALHGSWDPNVLNALALVVRPGDAVLDVGANVGYMAISLASRFRGQIVVAAFEPQPNLARMIAVSAALNGLTDVRVFAALLGDHDGVGALFVPSHGIHASAVGRIENATRLDRPVRTIDGLIADGTLPTPRIVKVDVEGGEFDVLRGAASLLRDSPPFVVFESDANSERFGYARSDLLTYLGSRADYRFLGVFDDGLRTVDVDDPALRDILAVPPTADLRDLIR